VPALAQRCPHDWSYEVTRRKTSSGTSGKANGKAGTSSHVAALASVAAAGAAASSTSNGLAAHLHRAGSDDSLADFAAGSASSAGARASRDAYAELAQADPAESAIAEGKWLRPPEAASRPANVAGITTAVDRNCEMSANGISRGNGSGSASGSGSGSGGGAANSSARSSRTEKSESSFSLTPPGTEPLPLDGATFVEAVHERVDLIALEEQLLRSADEKIVQRELAYLRELRYGKTASFATDDDLPPRIVFDPPDPLP
jgi:hypothetical protein